MAATLLAVIVALAIGHLAPDIAAGLRRYDWFAGWLRWLNAQFPEGSFWRGRYGIALALVLPLLVVGLLQVALDKPVWGFVGLLFDIAVLFYCWGPRDLDLDVAAVLDAPDAVARRNAAARLWLVGDAAKLDGPALVEAVFRNALRRWFGVLFWFLLLGPVGALLYRLSSLAVDGESATELPEQTRAGARALVTALDWPVAQLMTLAMALVGNFDTVFSAWREAGGTQFRLHIGFLGSAARASVRGELAEEAEEYAEEGMVQAMRELPELRDAMSLVWRILLLWLAVLAVFVIGGWVG